jgi:hypothetical protein
MAACESVRSQYCGRYRGPGTWMLKAVVAEEVQGMNLLYFKIVGRHCEVVGFIVTSIMTNIEREIIEIILN